MEPYAAADDVWRAALVFARVGAIVLLVAVHRRFRAAEGE